MDQTLIELDGTENKSNLGANAILGVSLAVAKCAALCTKQSLFRYLGTGTTLPIPMMNILNGGQHADNNIDFQEFMVMPAGAASFSDALRMGVEVFHTLKSVLKKKGYSTNVGDEGGFAPDMSSNTEAIETILESIQSAGYKAGEDIYIAMDPAASSFYNEADQVYDLTKSGHGTLTTDELIELWSDWIARYPIISLEDGLYEDDWDGWKKMNKAIGDKVQLVGDDLFVTNVKRLERGIEEGSANSILIKVNQIGTLTETINTINTAIDNDFTTVISHRSGETEDTYIADLAVAFNTGQIKTGSASRSDRIAKYNQLLRIEEELGAEAKFNGKSFKFVSVLEQASH